MVVMGLRELTHIKDLEQYLAKKRHSMISYLSAQETCQVGIFPFLNEERETEMGMGFGPGHTAGR